MSNIVAAGDSVLVLSGSYTGFDIRTSGTSTQPIVFKAVSNNVTINVHNPVTNDGINIEDADWIEVYGFNVINQPRAGIRIVLSDFVKIKTILAQIILSGGIFTVLLTIL
ncbi:MAG: hypothetical protein IPI19_11775 [Ignavibacteriales bacterium]|nr:hypothetical protein [Ignavibacteriales bacterium]